MADNGSIQSPRDKYRSSSFFISPRLFTGSASKGFTDTEFVISPTSVLDNKPFSAFKNPFWSDKRTLKTPKSEHKSHWNKLDSIGVGLGIVDEKSDSKLPKPKSRIVLTRSPSKIQIPPFPLSVFSPSESPKSPADFSIKTRNSQLGCFSPGLSPSTAKKYAFRYSNSGFENADSPRVFTGCLSASEMELSEDYTCVISHGPNPKKTHIFDDCIVESCCGVVEFSASKKENGFFINGPMSYPSESFLSFCFTCKKNLGQGKDIYMYRGEKAFCSSECRYKEMVVEEGRENFGF